MESYVLNILSQLCVYCYGDLNDLSAFSESRSNGTVSDLALRQEQVDRLNNKLHENDNEKTLAVVKLFEKYYQAIALVHGRDEDLLDEDYDEADDLLTKVSSYQVISINYSLNCA